MARHLKRLYAVYCYHLEKRPITTKAIVGSTLFATGDVGAQAIEYRIRNQREAEKAGGGGASTPLIDPSIQQEYVRDAADRSATAPGPSARRSASALATSPDVDAATGTTTLSGDDVEDWTAAVESAVSTTSGSIYDMFSRATKSAEGQFNTTTMAVTAGAGAGAGASGDAVSAPAGAGARAGTPPPAGPEEGKADETSARHADTVSNLATADVPKAVEAWLPDRAAEDKWFGWWDPNRTVRIMAWRVCLYTVPGHFFYTYVDKIIRIPGALGLVALVAADQFIFTPPNMAAYLSLDAYLKGKDPVQAVKDRLYTVMKAGWYIWPAVHAVTFSVIPPAHRLVFVNVVSMFWAGMLSYVNTYKGLGEPNAFLDMLGL